MSSTEDPLRPATWPVPLDTPPLCGALVRLEPIGPGDSTRLIEEVVAAADDAAIWRFLSHDGRNIEAVRAYVARLIGGWRDGSMLPFATRLLVPDSRMTGEIVGATRFKEVDRANRRIAIGSWFVPAVWGMGVNTESKCLLLSHAFEALGAIRVEFDTDTRNLRSQAALAALGAVQEGLLRSNRIMPDGTRRDSLVFSVIDHEWPAVRARLAARIARQRGGLSPSPVSGAKATDTA
jgi:N-acetyltransferase